MKYLIVMFLGLLAVAAHAGDGKGFLKRLEMELELNGAQKQQVKAILKKHHGEMKDKRKELRQLRKELASGMQTPKKGVDYRGELMTKFGKLEDLRREVERNRFEMALEIRELLNDDQLSKLKGFHFRGRPKRDRGERGEEKEG